MAIDASALLDAVRGVIRGELGTVRTIASSEYAEQAHADSGDDEVWLRATGTVQADLSIDSGPSQTSAVGPGTASRGIWEIMLRANLTYAIGPYADLTPARRYAAREEAIEDLERLILALTWPGNLSVDGSANATNLVSGRLSRHSMSGTPLAAPSWSEGMADDQGLLRVSVPFAAWVLSAQAVS